MLFLTERDIFDTLDFQTVWREGEQALGPALVKATTLTIFPGQEKIAAMQIPPEVAYVALVPLFRQPDAEHWKSVTDIRDETKQCGADRLHIPVRAKIRDNRIMKFDLQAGGVP